ncbi:MAG: K(+)-stimulated pyrophosphate-energized sodium pump, partial [Acidimicrobiaceae bacterium]
GPALNPLIKVMNLVSLLIQPAVISLRDNNIRFVIAGVALLVLFGAIAFSKRKTQALDADPNLATAAAAVPVG